MQNKDFLLNSVKTRKILSFLGGGIDQDEMLNPFNQGILTINFFSSSCQFSGDSGIFVSKIKKHSAADRAGLEIGDKIISVRILTDKF